MEIYILIAAILGALIGWTTNILAIKLLFRPYNPINILGLFNLQGLIPKRKSQLAIAIGQIVEQELLSSEEILDHIQTPELQEKLIKGIVDSVKVRASKFLPSFLPGISETLSGIIEKIVTGEVESYFKNAFPKTCNELKDFLPVTKIIEEKINQLEIKEVERIILMIAGKELRHIEFLGGLLGFAIGLLQGLLFILL